MEQYSGYCYCYCKENYYYFINIIKIKKQSEYTLIITLQY